MFGFNSSGVDTFETAKWTLDLILDKLDPSEHYIWEPFTGSGRSTRYMRSRGFEVTNGDHADFFRQRVPVPPENKKIVLVSNPPFSIKQEILKRIKDDGIERWALLLPISSICTLYFINNVDVPSMSILFHQRQAKFISPVNEEEPKRAAPFEVCWFCMNLMPKGTFLMPNTNMSSRVMTKEEVAIK